MTSDRSIAYVLAFLDHLVRFYRRGRLVIITDNISTRTGAAARAWLDRHPRVRFVFTPKHSSWLNQVEIWFGVLTHSALRHASLDSLEAIDRVVQTFTRHWNEVIGQPSSGPNCAPPPRRAQAAARKLARRPPPGRAGGDERPRPSTSEHGAEPDVWGRRAARGRARYFHRATSLSRPSAAGGGIKDAYARNNPVRAKVSRGDVAETRRASRPQRVSAGRLGSQVPIRYSARYIGETLRALSRQTRHPGE
jgi:transposase